MKILVLSDSHSVLGLMRRFIEKVKPDAVIHLGDHYEDGTAVIRSIPILGSTRSLETVTATAVQWMPGRCCAMMWAVSGSL